MPSKFLQHLAKHVSRAVNKHDGLSESISIPISESKYKLYHAATPGEREAFHEEIKALKKDVGALKLFFQTGGFGERDLLKRVEVTDSLVFLRHLGVPILAHQLEEALGKVDAALAQLGPDVKALKDPIAVSWREGRRYSGCSIEQVDKLTDGLLFLDWCLKNDGKQADVRTVSIQLFKNSKRLEGLINICANLLRPNSPENVADAPAAEVMSHWGVQRFPGSFRLRANIIVNTPRGELNCAAGWPYVALPPDAIVSLKGVDQPRYMLLIENKTTYERYCREIDDNGWIFYTNGFPSRRWCAIFQMIEGLLPENVPVYHWGDIDVGGFRIFNYLDGYFSRNLSPYCMDYFTLASAGEDSIALSDIIPLLEDSHNPGVNALLQDIRQRFSDDQAIAWVEQELLPVVAPPL